MKSIKIQMTIILISAVLILFSILGAAIQNRLVLMPEFIQSQYLEIASARADEVSKELEGIRNMVRITSQSPVIKRMNFTEIMAYLPNLVVDDKVRNMTIADPTGRAWTTYDAFIDISGQEQFQKIFNEGYDFVISKPFNSPFIPEPIPIITVSHVVMVDEKRVGLVNAVVSSAFLDQVVGEIDIKDSGIAYIIDEAGYIVTHPSPEVTLKSHVSEWMADESAVLMVLSNTEGALEYAHIGGETYVAVFSEIEQNPGWRMVIELPRKEAYAEYLSILRFTQWAFALGILIISIFSYIYASTISRPILALKSVFESASKGDFNVKANASLPNELGRTGEAFNAMLRQIKDLTYKDPVTELYNHNSFVLELEQKLSRLKHNEGFHYVVLVSLDDFKRINSIAGYASGNTALRILAARLKAFIDPKKELVARYYGDELIVLLASPSKDAVTTRIQSLRALCYEPLFISGIEHRFKASIGISFLTEDTKDYNRLIQEATVAKQKVKKQGGDGYEFYNAHINEEILEEQRIEEALFHAVENNELRLVYQPILSMDAGKVVGHEALLRWHHPLYGKLPTPKIIELAEKRGLIVDIGRWVMNTACRQNKIWMDMGYGPLYMAVNVSPLQLQDARIVEMVASAIAQSKLPAHLLDIEITETSAMNQVDEKIELLRALKVLGVKISIDDFGTGYSSLSYFAQFPVDTLKIDRMFVMDMLTDSNAHTITNTIIQMAKSLSLSITAEGVETQAHLDALKALGCDRYQGYLVAKPQSPEACEALLEGRK